VCVSVYVYLYVRLCVYVGLEGLINICVHVHACACVCVCLCVYACIYLGIEKEGLIMCVCVRVCVRLCTCPVHVCVYSYVRASMHISRRGGPCHAHWAYAPGKNSQKPPYHEHLAWNFTQKLTRTLGAHFLFLLKRTLGSTHRVTNRKKK